MKKSLIFKKDKIYTLRSKKTNTRCMPYPLIRFPLRYKSVKQLKGKHRIKVYCPVKKHSKSLIPLCNYHRELVRTKYFNGKSRFSDCD